jgi:peptidoglycan/LPS O-acetylase OafA/YrhL
MRNKELDGLRGLAAMAVALGHCNIVTTGVDVWSKNASDFPQMSIWEIIGRLGHVLFPADAAVTIFFVMSGYVLWGSLLRRSENPLTSFVPYTVGRLYRLLPVSIISAIIIGLIVDSTATELSKNAFFLSYSLNGVLWSLQVEMLGSFLIFFLFALAVNRPWLLVPVLAASIALAYSNPVPLILFLPTFILGISLHYLPTGFFKSSALLCAGYLSLVLADLILHRGMLSRSVGFISAWVIVGCVIQLKPKFLIMKVIQKLGDLSYSFYLSHTTGLICARIVLAKLPFAISNQFILFLFFVCVSLIVSLPLSWLIHTLVEKPGMQAGANLSRSSGEVIRRLLANRKGVDKAVTS